MAEQSRPAADHRHALPGWPRGLREDLAANYIGLSASSLRAAVKRGEAPHPVRLTRARLVWLREDLDAYLDAKAVRAAPSAAPTDENPWMAALANGPR